MTSPHLEHPQSGRTPINRRRAIGAIATLTALAVAAVPLTRHWFAKLRTTGHRSAPLDPSPIDPSILERMAIFTGALHGHRLDARDTREIAEALALLVQRDGGWRVELTEAADYVDRLARATGAASLADASDDVRDQVVDAIMRPPVRSRRSEALAFVSRNERARRRLRAGLVGRLTIIYGAAPPLWRRRGYAQTPGAARNVREYTRPGPSPTC